MSPAAYDPLAEVRIPQLRALVAARAAELVAFEQRCRERTTVDVLAHLVREHPEGRPPDVWIADDREACVTAANRACAAPELVEECVLLTWDGDSRCAFGLWWRPRVAD